MFFEKLCRKQDATEVEGILRRYEKEDFPVIMCMVITKWATRKKVSPVKMAENIAVMMRRMYRC